MDYDGFVNAQFIPRVQAALTRLRTNLVTAGVVPSKVIVKEVDDVEGVNDLRYQLVATRGARVFTAYIELTAAGIINGAMAILVTFWCDGNGSQITTSYVPGSPVPYNDPVQLESLLPKLAKVEEVTAGELLTAARAFLQV